MNILFFLSPKQDLMYVYDDFTLRQTLEKWENNRYASIPVLNRRGEYVGTLTEGDILWGLKKLHGLDLEAAEDVPISSFPHKRDYKAVTVTTSMDQLVEAAMNQNFVPVVDDRGRPSFVTAMIRPALNSSTCQSRRKSRNASGKRRQCIKIFAGKGPEMKISGPFCAKMLQNPIYWTQTMRYSPCPKKYDRREHEMKEFEMRNVGSHIEVYTAGGVFLFSADTVREAMEELEEEARAA